MQLLFQGSYDCSLVVAKLYCDSKCRNRKFRLSFVSFRCLHPRDLALKKHIFLGHFITQRCEASCFKKNKSKQRFSIAAGVK